MKHSATVLVIIVTWNKKQYVIDLLDSIVRLDYPTDLIDIVVVDNASTDGTVEALKKRFQHIRILENAENIGGTGGFNTGLAWAFQQPEDTHDYLWLLDNDVQVHEKTLSELVLVLESNPDAAVCGSTMMQLDYPWRINEMGAFVNRGNCALHLNRHFQEIVSWQDKDISELLSADVDLSKRLIYCQPFMDVDYVAAASLLIRTPVARQADLWMDFFIHFDDVEWCLRIAEMGHRILVSAKSLIWHMSAISKVPTWILYYDNRNMLYLLEKHSDDPNAVKNTKRLTLKKALYYSLIGKRDIAELHIAAISDFNQRKMGKKTLQLSDKSSPLSEIETVLSDTSVKNVLLPWTVNLQATDLQLLIVKVLKRRPDLRIYGLVPPFEACIEPHFNLPGLIPVHLPKMALMRLIKYYRIRNDFDLVIQSDYQPLIPLSWLNRKILFVNYENMTLRSKTGMKSLLAVIPKLWCYWR